MNAVQQPLRVLTIALGAFGACWAAPLSASAQTQAAGDWIVDARLRYESVSQDGLNDADALTLRTRLGYETRAFHGFKLLAEVEGVGQLIELAAERGRKTRPDVKLGICGEHGGDAPSIHFCEKTGLDYVSASPYRVPIARLAAAQAALQAR